MTKVFVREGVGGGVTGFTKRDWLLLNIIHSYSSLNIVQCKSSYNTCCQEEFIIYILYREDGFQLLCGKVGHSKIWHCKYR